MRKGITFNYGLLCDVVNNQWFGIEWSGAKAVDATSYCAPFCLHFKSNKREKRKKRRTHFHANFCMSVLFVLVALRLFFYIFPCHIVFLFHSFSFSSSSSSSLYLLYIWDTYLNCFFLSICSCFWLMLNFSVPFVFWAHLAEWCAHLMYGLLCFGAS